MFSKTNKTRAAPAKAEQPPALDPAPQIRKPPKMASVIAPDITIEGDIIGDGELHVDGVIRGDVRVARLSVGETGHIEGSVIAEALENRGRIVGSITAKQVRLMGSCFVDGDITHEQLTMESGAFFQGRSLKFQRQAPVAAQSPVAHAAPSAVPGPSPVARPAFGDVIDISAAG
jgi:cytoskeletal protein CcmA (bactofilin family)